MYRRKEDQTQEKGGGTVSIVTEHEEKIYRKSIFKSRRLGDNSSVSFGFKYGVV